MNPEQEQTAKRVEVAVWHELTKRRWFGKHIEEEEMDALSDDLRGAITKAVQDV